MGDKMAWFRVYYLFGEIIPCWWDTETGKYTHVTLKEFNIYKLLPLARIISEIARITRLEFFSSEIALIKTAKGPRKFVAVDYVNDQPELCVRPQAINGPLEDVTEHIADRCVEIAYNRIHGIKALYFRQISLARLNLVDENI